MSLTKPETLTPRKLAANRRNARRSQGAATPAGVRRAAAANLRHGLYSRNWTGSMLALGENPMEFDQLLESLLDTWQPANGFEMALVERLARTLWRMHRSDRIQEAVAASQAQGAAETAEAMGRAAYQSTVEKLSGLKALAASVARENYSTQESDLELFRQTFGREPQAKPREILRLLERLREPDLVESETEDADPESAPEASPDESEARNLALGRLRELLSELIQLAEKYKSLSDKIGVPPLSPLERDARLAPQGPSAALILRMEDSGMRQLWRITNLLLMARKAGMGFGQGRSGGAEQH